MIENQVAIVTGGTQGIGKEIALQLAQEGKTVCTASLNGNDSDFQKELAILSPGSIATNLDITKQAEIDCFYEMIDSRFGRADILINNAGIFEFKFLEDLDEESLESILNVNFKGQFRMIKGVIPFMKKNNWGRIILASSISGHLADVGLIGYAASKASVNVMTKIAAAELAPYNITVNSYAPGIIHTQMTDELIKERGEIQKKQIPLNRIGTGKDIVGLVSFLASDAASYITGEIIGVDGGFMKVQNAYRAYEYVTQKNIKN